MTQLRVIGASENLTDSVVDAPALVPPPGAPPMLPVSSPITRNWLVVVKKLSKFALPRAGVALVLVPQAIVRFEPTAAALWFCAGGVAFMGLDILLARSKTAASQMAAMLSDFIPESLALGAAFAHGGKGAMLLAILMALQNLPEGFNAYREMNQSSGYSRQRLLSLFAAAALLGPVAGVSGYLWLDDSPQVVAAVMLFAAGGILYSVFQDIAPQAKLNKHWAPSLGALLGFMLGIVGHMLTGG